MTIEQRLQEIIDSRIVNSIIVLHDGRSDLIGWCFLYDLRRGYYQFNEEYTKLELSEEKHYTKNDDKCIGLWI